MDGNLGLWDGNADLWDQQRSYIEETIVFEDQTVASQAIPKFNVPLGLGIATFNGNVNVITNADGNVPAKPLELNINLIGNVFSTSPCMKMDATKLYVLCFNTKPWNWSEVSPFMNYSIPSRPSVPYNDTILDPQDSTLEIYTPEECYVLKGPPLWKLPSGYYTKDYIQVKPLVLASKRVGTYFYRISDGRPYISKPEYIIYEPNGPYDTYGPDDDIEFTNNFDFIELNREEFQLKGVLNIQGDFYWCTLEYQAASKYRILSYKPIDKITVRTLMVYREHNKYVQLDSLPKV